MKKFFILALSLILCTISYAQSWKVESLKGDKTRGIEDCYRTSYTDNGDKFTFHSSKNIIILDCQDNFFSPNFKDLDYLDVTFFFYVGNQMIMEKKAKFRLTSSLTKAIYGGDISKEVFNHIKTKGDVRIIACKYTNKELFNINIPKNTTLII